MIHAWRGCDDRNLPSDFNRHILCRMDAPKPDPRLSPTPDYGTLTPASDYEQKIISAGSFRSVRLVAVLVGVLGASVALATGNVHATWDEIAQLLSIKGKPKPASPALLSQHEIEGLDH